MNQNIILTNYNVKQYIFHIFTSHKYAYIYKYLTFSFSRATTQPQNVCITKAVQQGQHKILGNILKITPEKERDQEITRNLLFHEAVKRDLTVILKLLLSYLTESNKDLLFLKDDDCNTALHLAVKQKLLNCCEQIMKCHSPTLAQKNNYGSTPLHCMIEGKFHDGCEKAMSYTNPGYINEPNNKGVIALHIAARENSPAILEILLNNSGDPRLKNIEDFNVLHYAANSGSVDCLKMILTRIPTHELKEYTNLQTIHLNTPLILASKRGFSHCCYRLKYANVDIANNDGYTALHYAAKGGHLAIVKYLLDKNALSNKRIKKDNLTAICLAAGGDDIECLEYLLDKTPMIDTPENPLKNAIKENRTDNFNLLSSRPEYMKIIDYQFPEDGNDTLMHISIKSSNYEITQKLIDLGADKFIKNDNDEYPVHLTASQARLESKMQEEERQHICRNILRDSHKLVASVTWCVTFI